MRYKASLDYILKLGSILGASDMLLRDSFYLEMQEIVDSHLAVNNHAVFMRTLAALWQGGWRPYKDILESVGFTHATMDKELQRLLKARILVKRFVSRVPPRTEYRLNPENKYFQAYRQVSQEYAELDAKLRQWLAGLAVLCKQANSERIEHASHTKILKWAQEVVRKAAILVLSEILAVPKSRRTEFFQFGPSGMRETLTLEGAFELSNICAVPLVYFNVYCRLARHLAYCFGQDREFDSELERLLHTTFGEIATPEIEKSEVDAVIAKSIQP